jgi:hypothetical protein
VKIANETDPDKKIYGLSMCKNIFNLDMIFDDVKKLLE